jgi:tetratricopeptide (TPR) repeat protein
MDALKAVLQAHASSSPAPGQHDPLQQQFESAVLLFVRGELREAVGALQGVQAAAEAAARPGLAGDACKWLGHAHLKLGDLGKAAGAFAAGCELAQRAGSTRLQVDCLSGMGTMYRDAGQHAAAGGFLRQALRLTSKLGGGSGGSGGSGSARASVLTLLGTVQIASGDTAAAVEALEEAVGLREDAVRGVCDTWRV